MSTNTYFMVIGSQAGAAAGGGGSVSRTVEFGPINEEYSSEIMRDLGRVGSQIIGHYFVLNSSHYVWYRHDGVGFDPGTNAAALSGLTGIQVDLPAGNVAANDVASLTSGAIDGVGPFSTSVSTNEVTISGASTVTTGTSYDSAGEVGVMGTRGDGILGLNSFAADTLRGTCIPEASLPSNPFMVTGFRIAIGNVHTAQLTAALYQGGAADDDFDGATLLGTLGTTTGSGTVEFQFVATEDGIFVDPTNGRIWVVWSHTTGGFQQPFTFGATALTATSDYFINAGGDASHVMTGGTAFSDPSNFPATMSTVASSEIGIPSIMLAYAEAPWHSDMVPVGRIGTRQSDASTFTSNSALPLLVGNSFTTPDNLGMEVFRAGVNYNVHQSGSDYRLALATGGAADNDFSGATWQDIGQTSGTATGWNDIDAPTGVSITASSRIFITLEFDGSGSRLAYDATGPDAYSPAGNEAAYYNGNTTECEVDDGSLGGVATTNIDFDPTTALTGVYTPDGEIYQNNNNVGVRMLYHVPGFVIQPA